MHTVTDGPLRAAIAAMTRDRVIGAAGGIPWHYPEDFKHFKRRTLDSAIVMGRLTWESIGRRELPQRRNIVVSRNPVAGVECYRSLDAAMEKLSNEDTWIIGGGQVYHEAMPWLQFLDITYVPDIIPVKGAVLFPIIDNTEWRATETNAFGDSPLRNVTYRRV